MNNRLKIIIIATASVLGIAVAVIFVVLFLFVTKPEDGLSEQPSIAELNIDLGDNVLWENVKSWSKEETYLGNQITIKDNGEELVLNNVEIGGRGNSTWLQEKVPLRVKLDNRENLFGLGKNKRWNLLANQLDDTHLRNEVAFEFWNMMGEDLIMKEEPVVLSVNGEYEGLYYLMSKIEISKRLVDLRDKNGILVELDNMNSLEGDCYKTDAGNCIEVVDLVDWNNENVATKVFMKKFNAFEKAAEEKNWEALQELCDIDSLARYYLVTEFSANPDGFSSSFFFYLDGEEDKIHAGPAWDFDFAFNNERWVWADEPIHAPDYKMSLRNRALGFDYYGNKIEPNLAISRMLIWMEEMPEFREVLKDMIESKLAGKRYELISNIIRKSKNIRIEAIRNNEKWDRKNYDEEVEKLLQWVFKRFEFIEEEYGKMKILEGEREV